MDPADDRKPYVKKRTSSSQGNHESKPQDQIKKQAASKKEKPAKKARQTATLDRAAQAAAHPVKPPKAKISKGKAEESEADRYIQDLRKQQGHMPLIDHLEELRWRIFRSLLWVALFSLVCAVFYDQVWPFVIGPLEPLMEQATGKGIIVKLITTRLPDYFLIKLKVILISGAILAMPAIVMELWRFVVPALERSSRKTGYVMLAAGLVLFWAGALLARKYLWPLIVTFLIFEWTPPEIAGAMEQMKPEVHLTISEYLSFFFSFHFAFGLACQLPIISLVLAMMGVLHSDFFIRSWRYAMIVISIVSAMVTPPDVASMLIMMVPLLALYAVSGLLVKIFERKRRPEIGYN